jgi:hypothetical protein
MAEAWKRLKSSLSTASECIKFIESLCAHVAWVVWPMPLKQAFINLNRRLKKCLKYKNCIFKLLRAVGGCLGIDRRRRTR